MERRNFTVLVLVGSLVGASFAIAPAVADDPPAPVPAIVTSFDGTSIAITVFEPAGLEEGETVPVIIHSHGWSGSRTKTAGPTTTIGKMLANGFAVVSVDARGHGESGGFATIHHRDVEVKDFQAVLDWIHDELDFVTKEPSSGIPKDVVAGSTGGSYGGGFQLMTSSFDHRLDALAPEITWNDLTYSLAPNGAPKSDWLHILYNAAKATGTRIDPNIDTWYREVMLTNDIPEAAFDHLKGSSPVPADITADVLLIQGVPDQLFNVNEALRNYAALENGAAGDVRLFTHLSGHLLNGRTVNSNSPNVGIQPFGVGVERTTSPCGVIGDTVVAWFVEKLGTGASSGIAEVSWALEDGSCMTDFVAGAPAVASIATLPAPTGAGGVLVPVLAGPATLAGVPTISASVSGMDESILHVGLVAVSASGAERVVDDQSTGLRLASGATSFEIELAAVATTLGAGDQLFLRVDGLNEWFVTNADRSPTPVVLSDVVLTLPVGVGTSV